MGQTSSSLLRAGWNLFLRRLRSIVILASFTLPASAALQFDVFLGYDGAVREASWFPIVCEIKNDGTSFSGAVEVSPGNYGKGQTIIMPVELPTGTLKRITIPAFASGRYQSLWNVRLVNERGRVMAEQTAVRPRRQVGWEIVSIGSLSRTASGAPSLRPIKRDQEEAKPIAARFQPSIFPDNPLVLEGLDAMYLNSEIASQLRSSQVQALLSWMQAGGHLIVAIEQPSDIAASPWLNSILPCEPKELRVLPSHQEFQQWLQSAGWDEGMRAKQSPTGQPGQPTPDQPFANLEHDAAFEIKEMPVLNSTLRDGRVVLASGNTPLLVTANRGLGRVTAMMFSPEREPFRSWKNLPTFWSRMAEVPGYFYTSADYYGSYGQSADGIFGAMIDSRQVHKLPITWLLLLLLVYLIVIGPLDRWWLNKIGRPMLTWITFPCYVVFFSLLIYFLGYKLRAGESEYNELHVVDVLRNGDQVEMRGRTYASLYSPANQKFGLSSEHRYATLRGEFMGGSGGLGTDQTDVVIDGDKFKAEVFVPVWTSQLYISDWWNSAPTPIEVKVTPRESGWQVQVENKTARAISQSKIAIKTYDGVDPLLYKLGEIPAGEMKTFTVNKNDGTDVKSFAMQHGSAFSHAVQSRQNAFGQSQGGQINDLANASMASSFLRQIGEEQKSSYQTFVIPSGLDISDAVMSGNAVVLAWSEDSAPVKGMNQFTPRKTFKHTLWRVPVPLNTKP